MPKEYKILFDGVILNQLKKLGKNRQIRGLLSSMLDKIEEKGEMAGKLVDSQFFIFEIKSKRPPIRLYFKPVPNSKEVYVFEYELKTSDKKQRITINRIKDKLINLLNRLKT